MTIKEQLWQEIESSSDELLSETLDFLQYLKTLSKNNEKRQELHPPQNKQFLQIT